MKLIGLGFKNYRKDKYNVFDAVIVIVSLTDFAISISGGMNSDDENGILSAFRAMRLLRIIKLTREWKDFQKNLSDFIAGLKEIRNFSLLLFIFIFIMALLGMEMFAYIIAFDVEGNTLLGKKAI